MSSGNPQLTLREILQHARKQKQLSQLELSMRLGISQRHLSFIESARARPSRGLLLRWLQALDVTPRTIGRALLLAGFAPEPAGAQADEHPDGLEPVLGALRRLLEGHDPWPGYVIDAHWNVLDLNRGGRWLAGLLLPGTPYVTGPGKVNLLELMLAPDGILSRLRNLSEVGPALLAHVRDDANALPALQPKAAALCEFLRSRLGEGAVSAPWFQRSAPSIVSRFDTPLGELAFHSVFTTFGTPQDIDHGSLRIEYMFPASVQTQAVLLQALGSRPERAPEVTSRPETADELRRSPPHQRRTRQQKKA
ncbi:MAG: helix-turn-helix domain-containing protein [Betaproteobacteria bacterium]|jgi:transcriptional regulator with XRE-family HTH domain